jgi:hypothetical protein
MQPPAVGVKMGHDLQGHDFHVESVGVLKVIVLNLINDVTEELGDATFSCLVAGVVIKAGFVGGIGVDTDNGCGIIGNILVIEGEAGRPDELGAAMVSFILGGLCKNGHEGMDSQYLVIWDDHEKGEEGLPDGKQVVVGWLPFKGGEGAVDLFEEAGDCISIHDG